MVVPMARTILIPLFLLALGLSLSAAPPVEDSTSVPVPPPAAIPQPPDLPEPGEAANLEGLRSLEALDRGDDAPAPEADRFPPPPSSFVAIELTPEGVVATDTLGEDWMYDFNRERFVPARRLSRDDIRGEDIVRPVEERALTQLEVKALASAVNVGYDEFVDGNIQATGRVVVRGWVRGNVQSFDEVLVLPTGQVDGNIRAPEIEVKPGGRVLGTQTISSISPEYLTDTFSFDGIWAVAAIFVLLLLVAFIMHYLAQPHLDRIRSCMQVYKTKSLAMGALLLILLGPVVAVLGITIVGIIPAILLILVGYPLAMGIGVLLFGQTVARLTIYRFLSHQPSPILQSLTGIFLLGILWFGVMTLATGTGPAYSILAGLGYLIAIPLTLYPACAGLGATFLTRLGYRDYISFRDRQQTGEPGAPAPAPPPIPKAPPAVRSPRGDQPSTRSGPSPLSSGNE